MRLTPQAAETVRSALRQVAAGCPAAGEPSPTTFAASNWRSPSRLAYLLHVCRHQIGDFVVLRRLSNLVAPTVSRRVPLRPPGRAALRPRTTPADAARVVELVNTCHGREAFFAPYNRATFEERLSRAPHAYFWPDLRLSDNAVMGVWLCGERRIVIDGQRRDEMVRGLVLDDGFLPEGEEDFVALIRHWCTSAKAAGITHLSIFSSPSSPGADTIRHLADRIQEFDFGFDEPEPADLDTRGLYVDAIYF